MPKSKKQVADTEATGLEALLSYAADIQALLRAILVCQTCPACRGTGIAPPLGAPCTCRQTAVDLLVDLDEEDDA